ncbi:uncharacterized protein BP5553_00409 [Venustampulla echinocandica]|uniref:Nephrocystin 3-like N-terminal domain-containing protein n=1 Tax=Venustampulla echinocandica TaxID=2656787 RepID=A0A370TY36_9HELO|nr:uncharacterized protein BP5553_00409 [Venustampulla echinocandica]RDL40430.1 hypothetical protein BP5553_00409 [Venustampulla echinocandica]
MAQPNTQAPRLHTQPPTVDFIDTRLSKYHPAFNDPTLRYDPSSAQYVPALQHNKIEGVKPAGPPAEVVMKFWDHIFPKAMDKLKFSMATKEAKGRLEEYSIRNKASWDAVYGTLEVARMQYTSKTGIGGALRKVWRKAADHIQPAIETTKLANEVVKYIPQANAVTPVFGIVEVLLDAVKTAAAVRKQILAGFEDLDPIFSDVELFLSTFPNASNITSSSIDLIATVFLAVECGIGFFIGSTFIRGLSATFNKAEYEKPLLDSLQMITDKSKQVEAHYSQNNNTQVAMNSVLAVLTDQYVRERQANLLITQENSSLKVEVEILRAASPQPASQTSAVNEDGLLSLLDIPNIDLADLERIEKRGQLLSMQERGRAEQIVHNQKFQTWLVSPTSTMLLTHGNFHGLQDTSALSLFCVTLIRAFRARPRFVTLVWFCGLHLSVNDSDADSEDYSDEECGLSMMEQMLKSLVVQLLCQYSFNTQYLPSEIELAGVQDGDLEQLFPLFEWLVHQLPENITLFCLIDGIAYYEREEFEDPMLEVLAGILRLTVASSIRAVVKVLVTSPWGTDTVRAAFEAEDKEDEEDLILSMAGQSRLGWIPSKARLERELGSGFEEVSHKATED